MKPLTLILLKCACALAISLLWGCRGQTSEKPPIHLNWNMDFQARYKGYQENSFYPDRRDMRPLPEGTVASQSLNDFGSRPASFQPNQALEKSAPYYTGRQDSQFLKVNPQPVTAGLLDRGRERYDIYCSMCHGQAGIGNGIVVQKGFLPPPSFHEDRIRTLVDGELFSTITHGIRNMPAYGKQIPADDRWAIVAYIRALQRSQNATLADVPEAMKNNLK